MDILLILLLAVGLSMDAFAVSVTNGMCYRISPVKNALASGVAFGVAQGVMPLIGFFAGHAFAEIIEQWDHWIALALLTVIGGKMIIEAVREARRVEEKVTQRAFSFKVLFVQAVATSIDALAIGVGLGVMHVNVITAASLIAATTFLFSFSGVLIGKKFGQMLREKAEILGGVILILIGLRIFIEHILAV